MRKKLVPMALVFVLILTNVRVPAFAAASPPVSARFEYDDNSGLVIRIDDADASDYFYCEWYSPDGQLFGSIAPEFFYNMVFSVKESGMYTLRAYDPIGIREKNNKNIYDYSNVKFSELKLKVTIDPNPVSNMKALLVETDYEFYYETWVSGDFDDKSIYYVGTGDSESYYDDAYYHAGSSGLIKQADSKNLFTKEENVEWFNEIFADSVIVVRFYDFYISGDTAYVTMTAPPKKPIPIAGVYPKPEIKIIFNGSRLTLDQPPVIEKDKTLVPAVAIANAMGAKADWNAATKTVTITKGDKVIKLTAGSNLAMVNGRGVKMDVPAKIIGGRIMVPLNFVSTRFDADVKWDEKKREIIITTK